MVSFDTVVKKFAEKGEKTGWTYIEIPFNITQQLKPNFKKSFRVKGFINKESIEAIALLPMGEGNFILALNNNLRKRLNLRNADEVSLNLELDASIYQLNNDLVECLQDDELASTNFYKLPRSHQNYYSKFVDAAKTDITKSKRIAQILKAMHLNMTYAEMIRSSKSD